MLQRKNKWCGSVTGASKRAISFLPALTMWRSVSLTALAFALPRDENSNCDRFEMARLNLINVRRHSDNRFCKVPIESDVTIYESITLTITIEPVPPQSPRGYHNNIHIQRLDKKTGRHRKENKEAFCHSLCNCLRPSSMDCRRIVRFVFIIFWCAVGRKSFCMRQRGIYLQSAHFLSSPAITQLHHSPQWRKERLFLQIFFTVFWGHSVFTPWNLCLTNYEDNAL